MPSYLESYEDNIKIDKDKCVFCGQCADRCILDNIRLKLAPCRQACPMGVNVQGYVQLIRRGEHDKAREMVREKLPFPQIICHVCHHPCENSCEKGQDAGQPVAIRALKRFLFEGAASAPLPARAVATGKRVAVVGAGPAGLVAAWDLALLGHAVTVYEAAERPGGMLCSGIPAFRLPQAVLDKELAVLKEVGIELVCPAKVGQDIEMATLMRDFDAVLLAAGLGQSRTLRVPGQELTGVHEGMAFLEAARKGQGPELKGHVLIAGGGNMAVDAAMTALRQGAAQVTVLALEAEGQLPAFAEEVEQAVREGVVFRHGCGIVSVEQKEGTGSMGGVILAPCHSLWDAQGNFAPCMGDAREPLLAETLIMAVGLTRDASLLKGSGLELRDVLDADPLTLQCAGGKVFAAGDYQGLAGSVIKAMSTGREAAVSVDRYVRGEHLRFERGYAGPVLTDFAVEKKDESRAARVQPALHQSRGKGDYNLLEQALSEGQARAEAERCLSCGGPCGKHRTCWFCLPCEVDCPQKAIWVDIPYLLR